VVVTGDGSAPGGVSGNLGLWYRADVPGATIVDEANVVVWSDQSGSNRNLIPQAAARAPSYESSEMCSKL